ncbi:hypothetical protein Lbir_0571 [Legionella birminghamensis]|uniref:Uncharacterized protein n=1 Tax=Legionella birminghamensis TaxID=28083 RepID=A0A378IAN9_9GAMM|nr:hypothetical protein [Legionella birminghamensis]KTC75197.1 hypothetical protein Lbir_0571 [Legionella birminghamensis]STX31852.1 Uncharacterised protein [Legionella birminghamensis]
MPSGKSAKHNKPNQKKSKKNDKAKAVIVPVTTQLLLNKYGNSIDRNAGTVERLAAQLSKTERTASIIAACRAHEKEPWVIVGALEKLGTDWLMKSFPGKEGELELQKLKNLGGDTVGRYISLIVLAQPKSWIDFTDQDYIDVAEVWSDPEKGLNDDELYYFVSNLSYFDYARLCTVSPMFQASSMAVMARYNEPEAVKLRNHFDFSNGYPVLGKAPDKRNVFGRFTDMLALNHAWFNQGVNFIQNSEGLCNDGGECFGITGMWLTSDKFHKNFRDELARESEYVDKPMVRQILALQRNAVLQAEAVGRPKEAFNGNEQGLTEKIIKDIIKNPEKDRMQFVTMTPGEATGHTMGMRIKHKDDGQIVLKYYDTNYGKRQFAFDSTSEKGLKQGTLFLSLCLMQSNANQLSYDLTTRKELEKRYKPQLVHQLDQKEALKQLREEAVKNQPPTPPEPQKKTSGEQKKTPQETAPDKKAEPKPVPKYDSAVWKQSVQAPSRDGRLNEIRNSEDFKKLVAHAKQLSNDDRIHALRVDKKDAIKDLVDELQTAKDLASFQNILGQLNKNQDYVKNTMKNDDSMISRYELLNTGQGLFTRAFAWAGVKTTTAKLIDKVTEMAEKIEKNQPEISQNSGPG